jgi:hypothetical protein
VFSAEVEERIRQMFRNVTVTLTDAEARWSDIGEINSHHVGFLSQAEALLRVARLPRRPVSGVDRPWRH